ncbi:arginase [Sphingobacterium sp. 2149]|uniref:arginase n=1 Tax=Sphingobacterium sp. 2149 TaxID=2817763 RepID=UPI001AE80D4A|nr:arginase [Sphingobacterium sp. 2149]MDR6734580.1 arginase [Sphingobacterium sp. 2149]
MERMIELIKNRSDIGAGTRGSDLGIDAIEIAAINKGSQYFINYPFVDVPTRNSSIYQNDHHPFGKHIQQIYEQCKQVASTVEDSLSSGNFPLVFSGDHSSAMGTISGIKSAYPDRKLGVIWVDAHADIHSPYTTPSGNMHGMPLAAMLDEDNMQCKINQIDQSTEEFWNKLKRIAGPAGKIASSHLIYFGVRDTEEPEDILIDRLGIKNYRVEDIRQRGIKGCVAESLTCLGDCDMIYVSFDVDSMDSELISDGTGTPVPKGFLPQEIVVILEEIIRSGKVVCFEIVEVNPLLDNKGNKMAEVAFDILERITPLIELKSGN